VLAAGAAVTLGSFANSALGQTTYTWIGNTGTFSTNTNWLNGNGPGAGLGSATTALVFTSGNTGTITATSGNSSTTPFVANSLTFNVNTNPSSGNPFVVSGGTSGKYQLDGTSPFISMNGVGFVSMFTSGGNIDLAQDATISGAGPGNMSLGGVISGAHILTVSGGNPVRIQRVVTLGGANTFSGLTIDGGTVAPPASAIQTCFGPAGSTLTVTANGGTMGVGAFSSAVSTLQLNGDVHFIGSNSTTGLTFSALLQGSGTLYNETSAGNIVLNNNSGSGSASPYTGAVVIETSELPNMALAAGGTLKLNSLTAQSTTYGSLNMVPSFDIRAGGTLVLDNSVAGSLQNGDRVGDTALMRLRGGNITLNGPAAGTTSAPIYAPTSLNEKIGALSGAGHNTITVTPTASTNVTTTLEVSSLSRDQRGTFNFRGTALGDGATTTRGRIIVDATGSGTFMDDLKGGGGSTAQNVSILPYAVGGVTSTDLGTSLVTYGTDGFRPLATSEYDPAGSGSTLSVGDPTNNVRLTGVTTNTATATMNALVLANGPDGTVTGTGTLNITSGVIISNPAVLASTPVGFSNNIAFGSAEGIIYMCGKNSLMITGNLTGSNGLTKTCNNLGVAGTNDLILTGDNHLLTGPLTINTGLVQFSSGDALPGGAASADSVVVNGTNALSTNASFAAGLSYYGNTSPLTISRPIAVNTGFLTVELIDASVSSSSQPPVGSLTLSSTITGAGSMNYRAQTTTTSGSPGEIFVTNTGNTYTGITRFAEGTTHIAADGSTGVGGAWEFSGGTLVLEGDVTNSRYVDIVISTSGSTIDTHGHHLTLNGPMTGLTSTSLSPNPAVGFTKNGLGTLTLNSLANTVAGVVTVNAGSLIVNGNLGSSNANALTINSGATLGGSGTIYRNTTVNGTLSPGNSPGILTVWGTLTFGASAAFNVDINGPVAGTGYDQVVQITQNASPLATTVLGSGTTLNVSLGYGPSASDKFWLINNTNTQGTANTTTGSFVGLAEGATVTLGLFGGRTYTAQISYNGNFATGQADHSGNDVVLYNISWTPRCGSADFNCDGDVGTDADIESFFTCLAGTCPPPPCTGSADFNGDGDVGTDADIEAFFRVLGGGSC
jgi:autotransporter-associated beta strand protein